MDADGCVDPNAGAAFGRLAETIARLCEGAATKSAPRRGRERGGGVGERTGGVSRGVSRVARGEIPRRGANHSHVGGGGGIIRAGGSRRRRRRRGRRESRAGGRRRRRDSTRDRMPRFRGRGRRRGGTRDRARRVAVARLFSRVRVSVRAAGARARVPDPSASSGRLLRRDVVPAPIDQIVHPGGVHPRTDDDEPVRERGDWREDVSRREKLHLRVARHARLVRRRLRDGIARRGAHRLARSGRRGRVRARVADRRGRAEKGERRRRREG